VTFGPRSAIVAAGGLLFVLAALGRCKRGLPAAAQRGALAASVIPVGGGDGERSQG
jgi:hypothetical protein